MTLLLFHALATAHQLTERLMCVPQVRVELWERQIGSAMAELQAKVESAVDQEELAQRLANIEARSLPALPVASIGAVPALDRRSASTPWLSSRVVKLTSLL